MIYDILFAVCGIGLIALGLSLFKVDDRVESWIVEVRRLIKVTNYVDTRRVEDSRRLDAAFKRIQELEDRLEAQAAELTEHHNKIDTLEINGSVYESIFEQQGLWGENSQEPSPTNLETGVILSSNWPGPFDGDND